MADVFTSAERSQIMRAVRSTDTKPEMKVRRLVFSLGYRYRLHVASLPGTPDLVFPRLRKIINISGCFWHMHSCGRCRVPETRRKYWLAKLERNRRRDVRTLRALRQLGWRVLTVWECQLNNPKQLRRRVSSFLG
jgi:DNA mismatch endonuclease, patch repair protein